MPAAEIPLLLRVGCGCSFCQAAGRGAGSKPVRGERSAADGGGGQQGRLRGLRATLPERRGASGRREVRCAQHAHPGHLDW